MDEAISNECDRTPACLRQQRSHLLFVLSNSRPGREAMFLHWYSGQYRQAVLGAAGVLNGQHYERHEVDITQGRYEPLPYRYLGLYDLSLDGAQDAAPILHIVAQLHAHEASADPPATWIYYPMSERAGYAPSKKPSMLTLAFANPVPGREAEFREWYATRHIRHALNITALVSGQCFERTQYQEPGALAADFAVIAVYEQQGSPEAILDSFASLPAGTFDFPAMDPRPNRFAEWVYRPV